MQMYSKHKEGYTILSSTVLTFREKPLQQSIVAINTYTMTKDD